MILVLGAGVAGLSATLAACAAGGDVCLVTAGALLPESGVRPHCNTALAQGGIAAAIGPLDHPDVHTSDTVAAGAGLVDAAAASLLTTSGAARVRHLIAQGFAVDRAPDGTPALGLEAAHTHSRIVHAGEDRTGAGLYAILAAQVYELVRAGRVQLLEHCELLRLITREGAVCGANLADPTGTEITYTATAVVLATGGYAALWQRTSNHAGARGRGIICAARAGAVVSDLEFVQFHPTVLGDSGFLISEAVRGAGAVLRDGSGSRFMEGVHPAADLAPRDVVSREIHRVLEQRAEPMVWLDATAIEHEGGSGTLARRFPKLTAATLANGFDWSREPIPVAPAAHYSMGGVVSDLDGRSSVPGLFVAGECAATGVHGANRLASNSLLEGLVFGERAGCAAVEFAADRAGWAHTGAAFAAVMESAAEHILSLPSDLDFVERGAPGDQGEQTDVHGLGSVDGVSLDTVLGIERTASDLNQLHRTTVRRSELDAQLVALISAAALERTESRGAHQRADYPHLDPAQARRRGWSVTVSSPLLIGRVTTPEQRSLAAC